MVRARDVAQRAGVSPSTVSRALFAPEKVAAATREKVLKAAAEVDYRPNLSARGLRLGRHQAIGLLSPDLENPYFAAVTKAVQARVQSAGYSLVITDSDEDADREGELIELLKGRVDGLVLASPRSTSEILIGALHGLPAVLTSRYIEGLPAVLANEEMGGSQVVGHLRALGHRRIAVVLGPSSSYSGRHRLVGLRTAADRVADVTLVEVGEFPPYFSGGFAAADQALASGATAVVAFNDLMAVGILSRLQERGVRVPEDISLVGFDDVSVANIVSPGLTTVRVPRERMAHRAVEILVECLDDGGETSPETVACLPIELVVRASSGEMLAAGRGHVSKSRRPHIPPARAVRASAVRRKAPRAPRSP